MSTAVEKVCTFLADVLERKGDFDPVASDSSLLESGRLDSFSIIEIVAFLEAEFGADFTTYVFEVDDFETAEKIAALVTPS